MIYKSYDTKLLIMMKKSTIINDIEQETWKILSSVDHRGVGPALTPRAILLTTYLEKGLNWIWKDSKYLRSYQPARWVLKPSNMFFWSGSDLDLK